VIAAGAVVIRSIRQEVTLERVLLGLLALALVFALAVLWVGLFHPLVGYFFSRETQTALTAYWLMRGGPIFAYETPVLGFPWSIPLEFPVYQIVVAILSSAGVPLDPAGRIVAFGFFVACLWPLHLLLRALRFEPITFPCVAILFVLSPIYLYWGRGFMIETCALFFCLTWLAYFAKYLIEPRPVFAAVAAVAGAFGILAKSTTFPAFGVLGGILFLGECRATWTAGLVARRVRTIVFAVPVIAAPFIIGILWTVYSDAVKIENEIGAYMTSYSSTGFTFGSWNQRTGLTLWRDVIWRRSLGYVFGHAAVPALVLIAATLLRRKHACVAAAAVLGFLVPFLVFTNLHVIHSYYQTANAIFIIAAAGLGLACVMSVRRGAVVGFAFLALMVAGQLEYFRVFYAPPLTSNVTAVPQLAVAKIVRQETQPDTSLLVIGDDWSSAIPYFAQRKSMVIPYWMPASFFRRVFAAPQRFLDGVRLGGVVYCTATSPRDSEHKALVDAFIAGRTVLGEAGDCALLSPEKS
jgi:hypothetical protein